MATEAAPHALPSRVSRRRRGSTRRACGVRPRRTVARLAKWSPPGRSALRRARRPADRRAMRASGGGGRGSGAHAACSDVSGARPPRSSSQEPLSVADGGFAREPARSAGASRRADGAPARQLAAAQPLRPARSPPRDALAQALCRGPRAARRRARGPRRGFSTLGAGPPALRPPGLAARSAHPLLPLEFDSCVASAPLIFVTSSLQGRGFASRRRGRRGDALRRRVRGASAARLSPSPSCPQPRATRLRPTRRCARGVGLVAASSRPVERRATPRRQRAEPRRRLLRPRDGPKRTRPAPAPASYAVVVPFLAARRSFAARPRASPRTPLRALRSMAVALVGGGRESAEGGDHRSRRVRRVERRGTRRRLVAGGR